MNIDEIIPIASRSIDRWNVRDGGVNGRRKGIVMREVS